MRRDRQHCARAWQALADGGPATAPVVVVQCVHRIAMSEEDGRYTRRDGRSPGWCWCGIERVAPTSFLHIVVTSFTLVWRDRRRGSGLDGGSAVHVIVCKPMHLHTQGYSMKIALIGVSGHVGSRLLTELLGRGHDVTGIARDTSKLTSRPGLVLKLADATQAAQLAPLLVGHEVVISATRFQSSDPKALIAAVKQAGVPRLMVVGGAASLEVAPGQALFDAPGFPEAYKAEAAAGRRALDTLR